MIIAILLFSVAAFAASFLITKHSSRMDRSETGLYIVLIAWGSLICGIVISHLDAVSVAGAGALR
jgi:hypothetical protein